MQKYKIVTILGDGAFGTVYKAVNTQTNEVVAIKKMKQKYSNWQECLELRQIKSLRKLNHPNIIKLKEVLLASEELHLVFEYLDTNLYEEYSKRKKEGRPFSETEIKNLLFQLASALMHMHKNGFFHRDLKPQNLLVSGPVLKLCDFGLARQIRSRPPFTDYVSTRWYRAPELLLRSTSYNSPVDVFAFACIMAELYNLSPLFPGNNDIDQLSRIVKILGTPEADDWPEGYKLAKQLGYHFQIQSGVDLQKLIPTAGNEAIDLIESSMKYSSRKRINMLEILKHPYFKGITLLLDEGKKQIIFEQRKTGKVFDTSKQQQKLEQFRATKQKFRQTRRHEALASDPLKQLDQKPPKQEDLTEDIDAIIKELQDKKSKSKKTNFQITPMKIPKKTREKFYAESEQKKQPEPIKNYRAPSRIEYEDAAFRYRSRKEEVNSRQNKNRAANLFAFGFQPATLPSLPLHHKLPESKNQKLKSLFPVVTPFRD